MQGIEKYIPGPLFEAKGVLAKLDKTQADLAAAIGRSDKHIFNILNGETDPKLTDCKKIYHYFKQVAEEQGRKIPTFEEIFYA